MTQKYKVFINNKPKIIVTDWKKFCAHYILIEAAGGLVYNREDELLMIFRNGKWDLPKGKKEEAEEIESCAKREVEEECGVSGLEITGKLTDTYHIYKHNGSKVLKRTYWFKMTTNFEGVLIPKTKEGITKVAWVKQQEIKEKLQNSYGNIKTLLIDR
jgi:8-oxo-dGTP pyrophosphatase MutT (NUDIX family)